MINNIYIQNYQSHKATQFDLHQGVNTIIGTSDSGKTAVLRALNWLINNRPTGDEFRSVWGGDTIVSIEADNQTITRVRSKNENSYLINDEELKAFGKDVPEEVSQIVNFSELNLQRQMDAPFLLSDSAGEIARYLNKIVDLDIIDESLSGIAKRKRDIVSDIESTSQNLKDLQEELEPYEVLGSIERKIERLESIQEEVRSLAQKQNKLQSLTQYIQTETEVLANLKERLKKEDEINKLIGLQEEIKQLKQRQQPLQNLTEQIQAETEVLDDLKIKLRKEKKINELMKLQEEADDLGRKYRALSLLINSIDTTLHNLEEQEISLKSKQEEFHKLMPEVCPLCGQEIKK